jgi:sugar/nucleoside kinase (ribokinase family)
LWREHFIKDLEIAKSKNCNVVVGLDAINDALVSGVTLAIGSHNDVSSDFNPADYLDRFEKIVVTKGAEGATEFSKEAVVQQPALAAQVIDATGAGDAFLAGYLAAMAKNITVVEERLALAAKWAAKTIATESSVPPPFGTLNVD